jgi:toxin ParE1/3/4
LNRYRLTKNAAQDLKNIWRYTYNTHGVSQADKYASTLKTACIAITETPHTWRSLNIAGKTLRVYHCEHHYIFYTMEKDAVMIIAFLHERMDFIARLKMRLT